MLQLYTRDTYVLLFRMKRFDATMNAVRIYGKNENARDHSKFGIENPKLIVTSSTHFCIKIDGSVNVRIGKN